MLKLLEDVKSPTNVHLNLKSFSHIKANMWSAAINNTLKKMILGSLVTIKQNFQKY